MKKYFIIIIACFLEIGFLPYNFMFAAQEKSLVILTCSYNNERWVEKNLDSIFVQNYTNFRVIYIDDCSTDNTNNLVKDYIKKHKLNNKLLLARNKEKQEKLKNTYLAIQTCKNNEIIIQLDGDDWFAHTNVFKDINNDFLDPNVWITYGQMKDYPSNALGYSKPTPSDVIYYNKFREIPWCYMPSRAFYAGLFKLIKIEDLQVKKIPQYRGKFYPYADDLALMYPMLEMAGYHQKFLSKVSYIRNRQNSLSWYYHPHKIDLLKKCMAEIKNNRRYEKLKDLRSLKF